MRTLVNRFVSLFLAMCLLTCQSALGATPSTVSAQQAAVFTTLRAALKDGALAMKVKGDGESTTKVQLGLTNKTDHVLKVVVPANEILLSKSLSIQHMMVTRDRIVTVTAGSSVWAEIPTMCVSTKTVPPPPAEESEFSAGNYPDESVWKQLASIAEAARLLNRGGAFDQTMFARERREQIIAQLAVWLLLGKRSGKPEDQVTAQGISEDTLRQMGIKREQLSKEKQQMFDKGVDQIFLAVDLTLKKSKEPEVQATATLPNDSRKDTFSNVATRALRKGDFTEAEELLTATLDDQHSEGENAAYAATLNKLGDCFLGEGKPADAAGRFQKAAAIREKVLGPEYAETAESLNGLGLALVAQGKVKDAIPVFERALAIRQKSLGENHTLVGESLNNLGLAYLGDERYDDAEQTLRKSLAIRYKNLGPDTAEVADTNKNLGDVYVKSGKYAQAEKCYKRALQIDQQVLGKDHPYVAAIVEGLADCYRANGRAGDADDLAKQSAALKEKALGSNISLISYVPADYQSYERFALYSSQSEKMEASVREFEASATQVTGLQPPPANRPVKDKWALVVGISTFKDPSINLQYAAKDAQDFAQYLVKEGHFAADHVKVVTNEKATRENIISLVGDKWLPRVANPDDLVLIYLSTHGSPSQADIRGTNYVIAYNTDKDNLFATGIAMSELTKMVKERVHSERIVLLLDACHSGAAGPSGKGLYRHANFDAESIAQGTGQMVICSSEPAQTSWESSKYPNGVFTHYLIEGLRQQGDKTTLADAYKFMRDKVQEEVLRDRGELQTPVLKSRWGGNELLLAAPAAQPRPGLEASAN